MGEGSGGGGGSERQEPCSASFCLSPQVCHLFYYLRPTSLLLFKFFFQLQLTFPHYFLKLSFYPNVAIVYIHLTSMHSKLKKVVKYVLN